MQAGTKVCLAPTRWAPAHSKQRANEGLSDAVRAGTLDAGGAASYADSTGTSARAHARVRAR
eukprot:11791279-Alexandrium_andersonii.AAC.1